MGMKLTDPGVQIAIRKGLITPEQLAGLPPAKAEAAAPEPKPALVAAAAACGSDPTKYLAEIAPEFVVVRAFMAGEPAVKERPRFNTITGRVYTPGTTKDYQKALATAAVVAAGPFTPDAEFAYGIRAVFRVQTHQRKDVDNMLKCVLDALNRMVFRDDSQVKELMGWSVLDAHRPGVEFVVYRLFRIEREAGRCVRCGTEFRLYRSWRSRLHCSRRCYYLHTSRAVELKCDHCGRDFLRKPSDVKAVAGDKLYCSRACKSLGSRTPLTCSGCGVVMSRPNSWVRPGQKRVFCSIKCRAEHTTSRKGQLTAEGLTAAALKGWATRRARRASA